MKFPIVNNNRIVFKHWTRKSYAVFSSISKTIKIAKLNIKLSENFGLKTENNFSFEILHSAKEKANTKDETYLYSDFVCSIIIFSFLINIFISFLFEKFNHIQITSILLINKTLPP